MKDLFKALEGVRPVEAPPFLFTRIQQRIQHQLNNRVSPKVAFSMAASLILFLAFNVLIITQKQPAKPATTNLAEAMHLIPDNNLY